MIKLNYKKNWYEIEFNGIKIFETKYPTNFIKNLIMNNEESKLVIDGKNIKWKNVIYINELSKYEDFVSLNKSNYLYKYIIEKIGDKSLVNDQVIENIINDLNSIFKKDILSKQYDINKIITACFEMNDLGFINDSDLIYLLNKIEYDEKKLIIFDNVSYINYNKCKQLLNNFNIFIITTDIRDVITNINELEICCFVNKNLFDVINVEKLLSFIEIKSSLIVNEQTFQDYLEYKNDQKSSIINFYLKNI